MPRERGARRRGEAHCVHVVGRHVPFVVGRYVHIAARCEGRRRIGAVTGFVGRYVDVSIVDHEVNECIHHYVSHVGLVVTSVHNVWLVGRDVCGAGRVWEGEVEGVELVVVECLRCPSPVASEEIRLSVVEVRRSVVEIRQSVVEIG